MNKHKLYTFFEHSIKFIWIRKANSNVCKWIPKNCQRLTIFFFVKKISFIQIFKYCDFKSLELNWKLSYCQLPLSGTRFTWKKIPPNKKSFAKIIKKINCSFGAVSFTHVTPFIESLHILNVSYENCEATCFIIHLFVDLFSYKLTIPCTRLYLLWQFAPLDVAIFKGPHLPWI